MIRTVTSWEGQEGREATRLSPWFDPFLPLFVRQAVRADGTVRVAGPADAPSGMVIDYPAENVASIFARDPTVAEGLRSLVAGRWVFCETPFEPRGEPYRIHVTDEIPSESSHRFLHRVRVLMAAEIDSTTRLLREAFDRFDERWLRALPGGEETGFVVEVGGSPVGIAWASVAGAHARLHSLFVSPRYRRLGIGTDLLFARLFWARRAGARRVLSEIAEENRPSRAIAERGGMRPAGTIYLYAPGRTASPTPDQVRAAPQNGQFVTVESMRDPQ